MRDTATLPRTPNVKSSVVTLPPINAELSRLELITVCTRPFRAVGPRIEAEHLGGKLLVHNYGHGGSGWSLSWGSAARVLALLRHAAPAGNFRDVAVIGCGALGLTTAVTLQRTGLRVRIYARDLPSQARSSRATGLWTPDSRFALTKETGGDLVAQWETMARHSWSTYVGMAAESNSPIDFHDRYVLSELSPDEDTVQRHKKDSLGFARLEHRLSNLYRGEDLGPGEHPFATTWAQRVRIPRFNITQYTERLLTEFRQAGGQLEQREFQSPGELAALPESTIVHCTGYGARALFGDDSLTPVRGQIGWLPAQPELGYSLQWDRFSVVPRGDGIALQVGAFTEETGWNDAGELPVRAESEEAVMALAQLQSTENAKDGKFQ